jgi:hypothetical protein
MYFNILDKFVYNKVRSQMQYISHTLQTMSHKSLGYLMGALEVNIRVHGKLTNCL